MHPTGTVNEFRWIAVGQFEGYGPQLKVRASANAYVPADQSGHQPRGDVISDKPATRWILIWMCRKRASLLRFTRETFGPCRKGQVRVRWPTLSNEVV